MKKLIFATVALSIWCLFVQVVLADIDLKVTVLESDTGKPIKGATVTVSTAKTSPGSKKTATTNDQGIATINPLRPGNVNHTVQVTYPTGEKTEKTLYMKAWSPVNLTVRLKLAEEIHWTESYKVAWVDFKANPDPTSIMASECGVSLDILEGWGRDAQGNLSIKAVAAFNRTASYVKAGRETAELLKHEQVHFDIAELYARKLRQALSKIKWGSKTKAQVEKEIDAAQAAMTEEMDAEQKQYDNETAHGENKEKQDEWNKKISERLRSTAGQ